MSVRTPEGFARKITWQVADVRRPPVSASHIIQARNDLFMVKNEAYIMNRKKEKSMLRKTTCTCLICSWRCNQVQPRQSSTSPLKLTQSINLQTEESKGSKLHLTAANQFFTAGGVSVEDRFKRTETVRPQFGEHCESQFECDSALSMKSDGNDIELNG